MEADIDSGAIEGFLAEHKPVEITSAFAPGDQFGDWLVTAFLGRGGSSEVYRVVHVTLGTEAALKVCVRDEDRNDIRDAAVCDRFRNEARMLADNTHPAFPRFLGFGEREGRPWYAMELLEHRPLPASEKSIVRFLLAVASGVRHLHSLGLVHRDIKPANILWRDSAPVLIDLGLVKDTSVVRGHAGDSLSIVDGKAVAVGTPRYAAPEQLVGDEITFATDVYALGMLANDCFGGNPPRAWRRFIQRATAAVLAQRYATVDAFVLAVKMLRARNWIVGTLVVAMAVLAIAIGVAYVRPVAESQSGALSWQNLCHNFTTNIVTGRIQADASGLDNIRYLAETNEVNVTEMKLDGQTVVFDEPLDLGVGREYWIVGPGVLDARFSKGSKAIVRIINCTFRNRTVTIPEDSGIDYVLDGGAYLNFMELPNTEAMKLRVGTRIRCNGMSEGRRWWRIKGPNDIAELVDEDNRSSLYSATMESK